MASLEEIKRNDLVLDLQFFKDMQSDMIVLRQRHKGFLEKKVDVDSARYEHLISTVLVLGEVVLELLPENL
jgi:hypothetical protein